MKGKSQLLHCCNKYKVKLLLSAVKMQKNHFFVCSAKMSPIFAGVVIAVLAEYDPSDEKKISSGNAPNGLWRRKTPIEKRLTFDLAHARLSNETESLLTQRPSKKQQFLFRLIKILLLMLVLEFFYFTSRVVAFQNIPLLGLFVNFLYFLRLVKIFLDHSDIEKMSEKD